VATPAGLGRKIRQHNERASDGAGLSLPCGDQQDVGHEGVATRGGVLSLRSFLTTCNVNQEDYSYFKVL